MRVQPLFGLVIVVICVSLTADVVQPQQGESVIFHLHPDGQNSAPGTVDRPWRSLQHAVKKAVPGSTIVLHPGTYEGNIVLRKSGTIGAPIIFAGATNRNVIVEGAVELARGVSHVHLTNMTVRNFSDWGITLNGDNTHIKLTHLTVIGGEAGIHLTYGDSGQPPVEGPVSDITLAHITVRDPEYTAVDCTPGPCNRIVFRNLEITGAGLAGEDSFGADGLAVERGENILVEDCFIHDNGGDGIDLNSRDRLGHVRDVIVRRNRVVRNHLNGIKVWAGGRIVNNAIWGQGDTAVVIGEHPGAFEVINNTVAFNMWAAEYGDRNYAFVAAYPNDDTGVSASIDLTLRNNIFAFNGGPAHGGPTGLYLGAGVDLVREGGNLFWSRDDEEVIRETRAGSREISRAQITSGWSDDKSPDARDVTGRPRFVSGWPQVDLRLREGSPAVDAGAITGVPAGDLRGVPRDKRPDIGAYERSKAGD